MYSSASNGRKRSKENYLAYCCQTGQEPDIDNTRAAKGLFRIGSIKYKEVAKINFAMDSFRFSFEVPIVDTDVPKLLSIGLTDQVAIYLNNLKKRIVHPGGCFCGAIISLHGQLYLFGHEVL